MGKGRARRLQIWPNSASGIEIEVSFCHPDYELNAEVAQFRLPRSC